MSEHDKLNDQQFDDNVRRLAHAHAPAEGPDAGVVDVCEQLLSGNDLASTSRPSIFRHRAVLSLCGMAASIAVVVSLIVPWGGVATVRAADVLARLNEKMAGSSMIELVFDNIVRGKNVMDGHMFIAGDIVAGDLYIHSQWDDEGDRDAFTLDMSLAFQPDGGWALIRKLAIPDPQTAAIASMFVSPGIETLLLLPAPDGDAGVVISSLDVSGPDIISVIQTFITDQSEAGATTQVQEDGSILVTVPITSGHVLDSLAAATKGALVGNPAGRDATNDTGQFTFAIGVGASAEMRELANELDDEADRVIAPAEKNFVQDERVATSDGPFGGDDFLVGSTLHILYDSEAEEILALEMVDVGDAKGFMTIDFRDGGVDPAKLDVENMKGPNTRVIDIGAFAKMFKSNASIDISVDAPNDK